MSKPVRSLLMLGTLILAIATFLLPGAASAKLCHDPMHAAASEPPPAADTAPAKRQMAAAPLASMNAGRCCGAVCKNAPCFGGKSLTFVPWSDAFVASGGPPPDAAPVGLLVGSTPRSLRKPPKFVA